MKILFKPFVWIGYLCYYLAALIYYFLYSFYFSSRIQFLERTQGEEKAEGYARKVGVQMARRAYRWFGMSPRIEGKENLPSDTNFLIVSNHLSAFDAATIYGHVAPQSYIIVKKEIEKYAILGPLAKKMGIFVDRDNPHQAVGALRKVIEYLKTGKTVTVFPEGTRSKDGHIGPFAKGSLRVAMISKKPIVPVVLTGNENIMPKGTIFIKRADVRAKILPAVDVAGYKNEEDLIEYIREIMEQALQTIQVKNT